MNKILLFFGLLITVLVVLFATGVLWKMVYFFCADPVRRNLSEINAEGLDETCEKYIGSILEVHPIYGWGWFGNKEEPGAPLTFNMRLKSLWRYDNITRGGIGIIENKGHDYDGWMVIFDTRHCGSYNFTDKIGDYNITITMSELYEKEGWPLPKDPNDGCGGYGEIKAYKAK